MLDLLSAREAEVFTHLIRGLSNKAIADRLFVSEKTIKFHCGCIYKKFGTSSRAETIVMYYQSRDKK